ncbi:YfhD family protein [Gracilibacillus suaedae]|uniref:YfhD family protein n=1 Tax=Gracilibacillus suaedae TaxID=2820273 RepID=UPI0038B3D1D7
MTKLGRDEHKKNTTRNPLAQTPKMEKTDGIDVEFSNELADADDLEAKERGERADKRAKKR